MNILFYGNGDSGNHGCEAIVRGTVALLGGKDNSNSFCIYSDYCEQDKKYGLNELAEIQEAKKAIKRGPQFLSAYLKMKMFNDYASMDALLYLEKIYSASEFADIALSVGGDNYCYKGNEFYTELNKAYHKAGIKTVLWGCSIEPELMKNKRIQSDINRYNAVVARESITQEALIALRSDVLLAPDPAFYMEANTCTLDDRFFNHEVIGINLSPMLISYESNYGVSIDNYRNLIQHIIDNTKYDIALIPHVVWPNNDDRKTLIQLYNAIEQKDRLIIIEDMTAPELKYCISKCKFFVGARTHATIAAYSSGVPTLVVGYSVKARGIAKDLFGDDEHYVIPVQSINTSDDLTNAFNWIAERETEIKKRLRCYLPEYLHRGEAAKELLYHICEDQN